MIKLSNKETDKIISAFIGVFYFVLPGFLEAQIHLVTKRIEWHRLYFEHKRGTTVENRFITVRNHLTNSHHRFDHDKVGRVAFVGGSITEMIGWRDEVCHDLQTHFPQTEFDFINAGISSTDTTLGAFRIQEDVFSHGQVDLLFVEFAVNELHNHRFFYETKRGVEGIVRQAFRHHPLMDVIFLYSADEVKIEHLRQGKAPVEITSFEEVAIHYEISSIDFAREVTRRIDNQEFTWVDFGGLHPAPYGHRVYAATIRSLLEAEWKQAMSDQPVVHPRRLPDVLDSKCYQYGRLHDVRFANGRGFELDGCWRPVQGETRKQFVDIPIFAAEKVGADLSFAFAGTAIGILVVAGPDAGMIEYRIDQSEWAKLDLFTVWSADLHIPWAYMLDADLTDGEHLLQLRVAEAKHEQSQGHAVRIAKFMVNASA
jgi:hypothetical protein